jgi:excinuclease ABC subunit C
VVALAHEENTALVQIFVIRSGHLVASESFPLENTQDENPGEIIASFLTQYYEEAAEVPPEILLPEQINDVESRVIEQWLRDKRSGRKVVLKVPQRGEKRSLIAQATNTAIEQLGLLQAQQAKDTLRQETALAEIQEALNLDDPPNRIECYDISTLQGTSTVGSRVVFVQGVPYKSEYRRFNVRSISHGGPDDYQSMREVLSRRFQRYIDSMKNAEDDIPPGVKDRDETWRLLPDLLIVDGGKGQLGVAVEVLDKFSLLEHVPVVGLAKRLEEVFVPGQARSVRLPRHSEGLYLLQRIRDEAHRFAITSNRRQRTRKGIASQLEDIPGIGPAKRKMLLIHFKNNIDAIRAASMEELLAVKGINEELAERIKASLG